MTLERFHQVAPESKLEVVRSLKDMRLTSLAERLIYEEWPAALPSDVLQRIDGEVWRRHLATGDAPFTTFASAFGAIDKLLPDADERGREILLEYRDYLMSVMPTAGNG